ncbi:MAG: sugar ABC transporter permease [Reinekea forsetii]|jgi:raffinose/stachyose/melibiose transport system permease protein|uniref:N-acetyl-D-glucosamine ABC transport system, permease protein 1 n=1 Tax=Reinekea forsetii TaxID=1336806 RepID=A0A2K8KUU1_9GAMM|nr:sugar ABC transporter permease [Reinekea forsetii]ATX77611.1 N-acetyl-D-glucosamine ABC transport system, permease protein 1 [Reinekea forsetii]MDO7641833.1 sugar ABC transporter permease [Reinekea forsetii]MDO7644750.1 sugar ABC transporter permease [Reinekea forsetii]MDO7673936.1 sugar ABC transporter permease [Reinekea forsetii]
MNKFPWHLVVFLAPAFIIYGVFSALPLADTLRLSIFTEDSFGVRSFLGWGNYEFVFQDALMSQAFWNALWVNCKFFFINMIIQNPIALLLAALLATGRIRGVAFYRTAIFLPTLLSVVIVGFVWKLMLSPVWGVGETLMAMVGLEDYFGPWLGMPESSLITVSLISVWQYIGLPMILIYAALIGIPDELLDAAYVDGSKPLRTFFAIQLPLIYPTLGLVTILTFVGNFNAFDLMYSVYSGAGGGPEQSVDVLGTFFYRTFFGFASQIGSTTMGATVASLMFLVICVGVGLYFYFVQRRLLRHQF